MESPQGTDRMLHALIGAKKLVSKLLRERYLSFAYRTFSCMPRGPDYLGKAKKRPILSQCRLQGEGKDPTTMELEAAKEILAEVFGITIAEVDLMIKRRSEERMQWPEKFWLDE